MSTGRHLRVSPFSWARRVALAVGVTRFACRMLPAGADKGVLIRRFALWRKAFAGVPNLLAWICRAQSDAKFLAQSAYARA